MPRRGDHIHRRKDGRWEGRYRCGTKENGDVIYRSVYAKTYGECKARLEKSREQALEPISKHADMRFSEVLDHWLQANQIRLKGATKNKYLYMINTHIVPELGNKKAASLTSAAVNTFLNAKLKQGAKNGARGLSPSYVKTIAIIIEAALKYAVSENICAPLKTPIYKPIVGKREPTVLSSAIVMSFEQILESEQSGVALGTYIALHTGMRIGEICALRWCDIDFGANVIYVCHTIARVRTDGETNRTELVLDSPKTASSKRQIPISSVLKPALISAYEKRKSQYVVSSTSTFVGTRTFDYRFRRMLKRYNVEEVNFHAIRHTFATRCVEVGMDQKTLSEILGHSNVSTTLNTYVHPSMEAKKLQIEKLNFSM